VSTPSIGTQSFCFSCNGESVNQRISYRYTPTNFGGSRLRFECPRCWRPCDILYGGTRFYCRECWRLTYQSQYDAGWERARSKAEKMRAKLGQPGFITPDEMNCFPRKPKWMRWQTYERMQAEDERLLASYEYGFACMVQRFVYRSL
jgi:hypothetical protein